MLEPTSLKKAVKKLSRIKMSIADDCMNVDTYWCRFAASSSNSDESIAVHHHSFFELHFCLSGEASIRLNDNQDFFLTEGKFILLPKNIDHKIEFSKDFTEFVCGFQIKLNEQHADYSFLSSALYQSNLYRLYTCSQLMERYVEDILNYTHSSENGLLSSLSATLKLLLIEIFRIIAPSAMHPPTILRERSYNTIIAAIQNYVENNIATHITGSAISQQVGYSIRHLNRITQQHLGMTLQQLVDDVRLKHIRVLLETTDMSLSDIAERVGYSSEFSLNRFFKKAEGMSAGRYRQSIKY